MTTVADPLLASERRNRLVEILGRDGSVRLESAAAELGVSPMTIRRDLVDLEAEGFARRVRGGAVAVTLARPYVERMATGSAPKALIAQKALALVPSSGAVAIDASTTSSMLINALDSPGLIVATNSLDNAAGARRRPGVRSILVGGELDEATGSFVGPIACSAAAALDYTRFFCSTFAVNDSGTSEVSLDEAQVKRVFARSSAHTVILADSSKLGGRALAVGLDWESIDVLVTDLDPADARLDPYRDRVELL